MDTWLLKQQQLILDLAVEAPPFSNTQYIHNHYVFLAHHMTANKNGYNSREQHNPIIGNLILKNEMGIVNEISEKD